MTVVIRFTVTLLIVAACVLAWALAQGIGQSVGNGLTEWGIR